MTTPMDIGRFSFRRSRTSRPTTREASARSPSSEWHRVSWLVSYGTLVSVTIIVLIMPVAPADDSVSMVGVVIFLSISWLPSGLFFAAMLWWISLGSTPWRRLGVALPLFALVATTYAACYQVFLRSWFDGRSASPVSLISANLLPIFFHALWCSLAYGGVAAVIYLLMRHVDQTTATLHAIAIARERNEAAIADEAIRAMVERIEPRLLLDAMTTAQQQYEHNPAEAEETLRVCTEFLRCAMPQSHSGRSTVGAELMVGELYLRLRDRVDRRPVTWRIHRPVEQAIDALLANSPMPAMALLPVLERLRDPERHDDRRAVLDVTVVACAGSIEIQITAPVLAPIVDDAWRRAMGLRLASVCGPGASVRVETRSESVPSLLIVVPVHAVSSTAARH